MWLAHDMLPPGSLYHACESTNQDDPKPRSQIAKGFLTWNFCHLLHGTGMVGLNMAIIRPRLLHEVSRQVSSADCMYILVVYFNEHLEVHPMLTSANSREI